MTLEPAQKEHIVMVRMGWLVVFGVFSGGCLFGQGAPPQTVVATRSPADLSCPKEKVTVEAIGGSSFRASGCGQTATYTCMGGNVGNPYDAMCTREATAMR